MRTTKICSVCLALAGFAQCAVAAQTFYSQIVSNDQPLAYWNFDEPNPTDNAIQQMPVPASPTTVNDLVPAFAATRVAHAAVGSGLVLGNAADLDGVTANFNAPALNLGPASLATPWAIEFWVQIKPGYSNHCYVLDFNYGGSQGIAYDWTPNWMYMESSGASGGLSISTQDTNWHHLAWVYYGSLRSASQLDIYFDGVLNANLVAPPNPVLSLSQFVVGDYRALGGLGFLGRLDEVAIYDLSSYTSEAQLGARVAALVNDHLLASTVNAAGVTVSITQQPADVVAFVGQAANFSVAATASSGSLAYQWQENWQDIPGATNAAYTTPTLGPADAGTNFIRARVSSGDVFAYTREAVLAVQGVTIGISQQPTNVAATIGESAVFSVVATSSPPAQLSYQWSENTIPIPGATNSSYTTPVLQLRDVGTNLFSVTVSLGSTLIGSDTAALIVAPPVPPVTLYSQVVSNDAPILYWNFDEPQGNAIQQMPVPQGPTTANDLAPTVGGGTLLAGRVDHAAIGSNLRLGYAADFNRHNDFNAASPQVGTEFYLLGAYGIEFWMQALETQNGTNANDNYLLSFNNSGSLAVVYDWHPEDPDTVEMYGGTEIERTWTNGFFISAQTDTNWHHIFWVYYDDLRTNDYRLLDVWGDGVRIANVACSPTNTTSGFDRSLSLLGPIIVGAGLTSGAVGFQGRIDEVAIYDFSSFADETTLADYVNDMVARHLAAAYPTGPIPLSFSRSGNQLTLSWSGDGFVLQATGSLSNPHWANVTGGNTSPFTVSIGPNSGFYRLFKP
jgi:hypothetical protein